MPISQNSCQQMKGAFGENKMQGDISDTKRKKNIVRWLMWWMWRTVEDVLKFHIKLLV